MCVLSVLKKKTEGENTRGTCLKLEAEVELSLPTPASVSFSFTLLRQCIKKDHHLIKLHIKQGICNVSCNMSRYVLIFHRSHLCAEPRRRVDGLENGDPPSSHPVCFHLVLSGHRAAEEGGEEVGQEVQVDEHEGGVWPSLLCSLAQPLHSP